MIRQLAGALAREIKRELSTRGIAEFNFGVSQFGPYRFRCGNQIEYTRTVGLGGEAAVLGAFLFLLRPDDRVWDIGASVGLFSVHAAGVAKEVVAFEPDPATFKRLRQNVELNRLAGRVTCRMEALGDQTGEATLWTDGLAGSAPSLADRGRHAAVTNVSITTVDHLLDAKTPLPTVLKIDVEGAEMLVLRGAGRLLASDNAPRLIFLEVHPRFLPRFGGSEEGVQELILEHGYVVVARRAREKEVHLIAIRS